MVIVFDLDDTLYNEIDFAKSAFQEVACYLGDEKYYEFMLNILHTEGSGRIFNRLVERFDISVPIQKLIEIYRFHSPDIKLDDDSRALLEFSRNYNTALISDGHYIMQQNKFKALELDEYIDFPVFTDFYHTKKPETKAFKMIEERFSDDCGYVYISDNPQKDFIAPNKLGWQSIRYKNPEGVYRQYKSDAAFEVENKKAVIDILRGMLI